MATWRPWKRMLEQNGTDLGSACMKSLQCWTFLSLVDSRGESLGELDARSFVLGYRLKEQIPKAMLLQPFTSSRAKRYSRSLQSNRLTFGFELGKNLTGAAEEWARGRRPA